MTDSIDAPMSADAIRSARPGKRPRPGRPVSPKRPVSPVRSPGPGRPGRPARTGPGRPAQNAGPGEAAGGQRRWRAGTAAARQAGRTSFVLLVLGLLGGGLVCLLVVNTTLAANSIEINGLQQANAVNTQRMQELQQQVAAARSASVLAKKARRLGMRPDPVLSFVDLRTGRIGVPGAGVAGAAGSPGVPGRRP